MKRPPFDRLILIILVAATVIGTCAWMLSTTTYQDDWCYRHATIDADEQAFFDCEGPLLTSVTDLPQSMLNHARLVNNRLPNLLMAPLSMLPRPAVALLCGLLMVLLFVLLTQICNRPLYGRAFGTFLMLLFWTAFPWYDHFQSIAFQLNYIPPNILACLIITRLGSRSTLSTAALCFITGWWHEEFGIAVGAFILADAIISRRDRRTACGLLAAVALGVALAMAGGLATRIIDALTTGGYVRQPLGTVRFLTQLWPLWLAIALFVITLLRRRTDRKYLSIAVPSLAAAVVVACLVPFHGVVDRGLWPCHLFAVIAILAGTDLFAPKRPSRIEQAIACIFTLLYIAWLAALVAEQRRITAEQQTLSTAAVQAAADSTDIIFADITRPADQPVLLLGISTNAAFFEYDGNRFFHRAHDRATYHMLAVMPAECRGKDFDEWPRIPGRNDLRGCWPVLISRTPYSTPDDWKSSRPLHLSLGAPTAAAGLVDRLLGPRLYPDGFDVPVYTFTLRPAKSCITISNPHGSTDTALYLLLPADLPTTVSHRHITALDTLPQ